MNPAAPAALPPKVVPVVDESRRKVASCVCDDVRVYVALDMLFVVSQTVAAMIRNRGDLARDQIMLDSNAPGVAYVKYPRSLPTRRCDVLVLDFKESQQEVKTNVSSASAASGVATPTPTPTTAIHTLLTVYVHNLAPACDVSGLWKYVAANWTTHNRVSSSTSQSPGALPRAIHLVLVDSQPDASFFADLVTELGKPIVHLTVSDTLPSPASLWALNKIRGDSKFKLFSPHVKDFIAHAPECSKGTDLILICFSLLTEFATSALFGVCCAIDDSGKMALAMSLVCGLRHVKRLLLHLFAEPAEGKTAKSLSSVVPAPFTNDVAHSTTAAMAWLEQKTAAPLALHADTLDPVEVEFLQAFVEKLKSAKAALPIEFVSLYGFGYRPHVYPHWSFQVAAVLYRMGGGILCHLPCTGSVRGFATDEWPLPPDQKGRPLLVAAPPRDDVSVHPRSVDALLVAREVFLSRFPMDKNTQEASALSCVFVSLLASCCLSAGRTRTSSPTSLVNKKDSADGDCDKGFCERLLERATFNLDEMAKRSAELRKLRKEASQIKDRPMGDAATPMSVYVSRVNTLEDYGLRSPTSLSMSDDEKGEPVRVSSPVFFPSDHVVSADCFSKDTLAERYYPLVFSLSLSLSLSLPLSLPEQRTCAPRHAA